MVVKILIGVIVGGALLHAIAFIGKSWSVGCLDNTFKDRIGRRK